jgi:hypothetical protein
VAEHEQESGRGALTEREREALQILAREFVKEAGLQQPPEQDEDWDQEAWVEGQKLTHETKINSANFTCL